MKTHIVLHPAARPDPRCCSSSGGLSCAPRSGGDTAAFAGALDQAVLAGALNQLMRYTLTGCGRSAMCAAFLIERIAASRGTSEEMRAMCCKVCEMLEQSGAEEAVHG